MSKHRSSEISPDHSPRASAPYATPGTGLAAGRLSQLSRLSAEFVPSGPVPFIEWGSVSSFFAGLVVINALYIGLDTHMRAAADDGTGMIQGFFALGIELIFFFLFGVELVLRAKTDGCPRFFYSHWNILDAFLVSTSGLDLAFELVAIGQAAKSGNMSKFRALRLLKITRMVRVVRVLRVFRFKQAMRIARGFILLIKAIVGACQSLGWVMVFFIGITYMCGIITTEFIGLDNEAGDEFVEEMFGDLVKSMFTLFQISTLSDWAVITRHVIDSHGGLWMPFFMLYLLLTNTILMNVVLATLIENVFALASDVKEAQEGKEGDYEEWMLTPRSLGSENAEEEEGVEEVEDGVDGQGMMQKGHSSVVVAGGSLAPQQSASQMVMGTLLSELFDLVSTFVGVEGVNQRRLVTEISLADSLERMEVKQKMAQACPALKMEEVKPAQLAEKIFLACPKCVDSEGMSRLELVEACMALSGELSMNHFVTISQALTKLEKHVDHELVHLNKHQRKMNRRFLKLRHRLRKVYHFDGAPRKMVEMVNEMKRKNMEREMAAAKAAGKTHTEEDSGEISMSEDSSEEGGENAKW